MNVLQIHLTLVMFYEEERNDVNNDKSIEAFNAHSYLYIERKPKLNCTTEARFALLVIIIFSDKIGFRSLIPS